MEHDAAQLLFATTCLPFALPAPREGKPLTRAEGCHDTLPYGRPLSSCVFARVTVKHDVAQIVKATSAARAHSSLACFLTAERRMRIHRLRHDVCSRDGFKGTISMETGRARALALLRRPTAPSFRIRKPRALQGCDLSSCYYAGATLLQEARFLSFLGWKGGEGKLLGMGPYLSLGLV